MKNIHKSADNPTEHKNLEYVGEINEHALCPNTAANALKKILNFRNLLDILQLLNFRDVEAANLVFTVQNLIVNSRPFTFRVRGFFHVNHENH